MSEARKLRRAKKNAFVKQLKRATFDEFENLTSPLAREKFSQIKLGEFMGFYANSIYSVQIFKRRESILLGIRRHDEKPICPWRDKQKIKNIFIGEEDSAVEFMPPESSLVDQANIFWISSGPIVNDLYERIGGLRKYN